MSSGHITVFNVIKKKLSNEEKELEKEKWNELLGKEINKLFIGKATPQNMYYNIASNYSNRTIDIGHYAKKAKLLGALGMIDFLGSIAAIAVTQDFIEDEKYESLVLTWGIVTPFILWNNIYRYKNFGVCNGLNWAIYGGGIGLLTSYNMLDKDKKIYSLIGLGVGLIGGYFVPSLFKKELVGEKKPQLLKLSLGNSPLSQNFALALKMRF